MKGTFSKGSFLCGAIGSGGGGETKEVALLSITTAPTGEFAKGSKYYNLTDKKIYTAVVADSWDGATVDDPQFGTYYLYNNSTYVWDGNSLEEYEFENFVKKTDIVNNLESNDPTKVLGAGQGKALNQKVELKQNITDDNLKTEAKTIVRAINEINQAMIGLPDLIIAENKILNTPLFYNGRVIINNGITITINEPLKPLIIKCNELINNGTIDVTGKGFQGKKVQSGEGIGYCDGDNAETTGSRAGGGAPSSDKPSAYRTMLGLASALGGSFAEPYGSGYDGANGGGGGGGSDGGPLSGGGSGAGGGGGGAGHGNYGFPKGGNGSQADTDINLELFKNNQLEEIPLFGASGASGWQDGQATSKDTSNGGGNIQIYADKVENNGIIRANGETVYLTTPEQNGGCGGAGGGCIMIRTKKIINSTGSVIEAKGSAGHKYSTYQYCGNGGDGLILIDILKSNYNDLENKPKINGVELSGEKTAEDLHLVAYPENITDLVSTSKTFDSSNKLKVNADYTFGELTSLTFDNLSVDSSPLGTTIKFNSGSTATVITDNSGIDWVDGSAPVPSANKTCLILIFNKIGFYKEW